MKIEPDGQALSPLDIERRLAAALAASEEAQQADPKSSAEFVDLQALSDADRQRLERARNCLKLLHQASLDKLPSSTPKLAGENPWLKETAAELSAPVPDEAALLKLIREEIHLREALGQPANEDEYLERYPEYADLLHTHVIRPRPTRPAPDAAPPALPGFVLKELLGRGGMGVVWKAWQPSLKRWVALKMIRAGALADEDSRRRLQREAETMARLRHPNIVQVYEVGEHAGQPFVAFELVEGGSLDKHLAGRPLPSAQTAELIETLARAVYFAHEHDIVHRDLKPANVLLAACGLGPGARPQAAEWIPKITDFGLAKQLDLETGQTQSGMLVGTPSYMAPEQAAGTSQAVGPAVDIHALGAILYEVLTGRSPFQAATALETMLRVRSEEPLPPRRLQPNCPRDLETICLKCLEKEPRRRYGSALTLAEDLRRFLLHEPIRARPVSSGERLVKWARRRPAVAALAAGIVVVTTVSLALLTGLWRHAAASADAEKRARVEEQERALHLALTLCKSGDSNRGHLGMTKLLQAVVKLRDVPGASVLEQSLRWNLAAWRRDCWGLEEVWEGPGFPLEAKWGPDGLVVLTHGKDRAGKDMRPRLWWPATGDEAELSSASSGVLRAGAFDPKGQRCVTAGREGVACLWEVGPAGGRSRLLHTLRHGQPIEAAVFSPDGTLVATGGTDKLVRLWNAATGKALDQTLAHDATVYAVAFSPDSRRLITGTGSGIIRLWELHADKPPRVLAHYLHQTEGVRAVACSPDGKWVALSCLGGEIKVWDVEQDRALDYHISSPGAIRKMVFSPDSRLLLTAGGGKNVSFWDVRTGRPVGAPLLQPESVCMVAIHTDGHMLLTGSREHRDVRLWHLPEDQPLCLAHANSLRSCVFSADGRLFVTSDKGGGVRLWARKPGRPTTAATIREVATLASAHTHEVTAVALSPNGQLLATSSLDGTARLWETATGEPRGRPFEHKKGVSAVAFPLDGRTLITAGADRVARLWDVATGQQVGAPMQHRAAVQNALFSPNGRMVATISLQGTARVWDAATGIPLTEPLPHPDEVYALAFSPDSLTLVIGWGRQRQDSGGAQRWDVATGQPLAPPLAHSGLVKDIHFSPDGQTLATASHDKTVRLWDAATGELLGSPLEHEREVAAVVFRPDGRLLATGDRGGTGRFWDAATGKQVGPTMQHTSPIHALVFSPDGTCLLSGGSDGLAWLWPVPTLEAGAVEHVVLEAQVRSGLVLEGDLMRVLNARAWQEAREQMRQLTGKR